MERPEMSRALDRLEHGDVLNVWTLDPLGHNTRHVLDTKRTTEPVNRAGPVDSGYCPAWLSASVLCLNQKG